MLYKTLDIKQNILNLEKAVNNIETRFITRVLRTFPSVRRRITDVALAKIINIHVPQGITGEIYIFLNK